MSLTTELEQDQIEEIEELAARLKSDHLPESKMADRIFELMEKNGFCFDANCPVCREQSYKSAIAYAQSEINAS